VPRIHLQAFHRETKRTASLSQLDIARTFANTARIQASRRRGWPERISGRMVCRTGLRAVNQGDIGCRRIRTFGPLGTPYLNGIMRMA
jgi:hypothetical protein